MQRRVLFALTRLSSDETYRSNRLCESHRTIAWLVSGRYEDCETEGASLSSWIDGMVPAENMGWRSTPRNLTIRRLHSKRYSRTIASKSPFPKPARLVNERSGS